MEKTKNVNEKIKEILNKAIASHFTWKVRLKNMIDLGESNLSIQDIRDDSLCEFGKCLNSLSKEYAENEYYQNIKNLHTEFHINAAKIVLIALSGHKERANELFLSRDSDFVKNSTLLTLELSEWRDSL